ncbi:MAG: rhomboid family intramembrane serine protease [Armatimonadota bacterium]|nr:rhomboid family intramembrane serine protease [Armatimonadota bacterium]MDR7451583.1 rhomboid family intramembrane serine protease [Armatimonadota bacterium]MDR7467697.1 rhomboid family intramembrane serine protease [Armatimonadota bacterium]MDR7492552.1 rhomboid family intramembrane serine protease [Armatimonadota bacterium]MDR7500502.1 rhomboid family intramembrane serine protease [Armatimonadota bacterium]
MIPLRDENPSSSRPIVTYLIILANVLVFLFMLGLGSDAAVERFVLAYGAVPARITGAAAGAPAAYPTLLTSMFLHGGWAHLLGNMLYLWIFGDNVEDLMGHGRFLIFYLLTGMAAVWAHILTAPASAVPLIGASGAIAGVLGAYLALFPRARIISLVPFGYFLRVVAVPAVLFLPLWFLLQFVQGVATLGAETAGVAWWAHIGGFASGFVLVWVFARRRRSRREWW